MTATEALAQDHPAVRKIIVIDLYCRISRDYDGTLRKVEAQEVQGRGWIKDHAHEGYVLGQVHRDHALSGWRRNVKRPSFDKLMERLESGACDGVWFRDLDRYTRKMEEALHLLKVADRGAVVLGSDGKYDLTTASGRSNFRDKANRGETESEMISERTCRGKLEKVRRGKSNASYRGFARDGFLPNPEGWEPGDPRTRVPPEQLSREREIVRNVAARLLVGETLNSVVLDLNRQGITTVTGGGWNGQSLRQLLEAPSLAGLIEHKGTIIGEVDGEHALDRETWDRLQLHFASRKRGRPAVCYLGSGILRCGKCGGKLYGRPVVSQSPYPDGEVRRQYWCQYRPGSAPIMQGCGTLTIDQRYADSQIEKGTLGRLSDPEQQDRVAQYAAKVAEAREHLVGEVAKLEDDARTLASKVSTWGMARVDAAMGPLDERLASLREQLDSLDAPESVGEAGRATVADWKKANISQRRVMVVKAFPEGLFILPATSRGAASLTPDRFHVGAPAHLQ